MNKPDARRKASRVKATERGVSLILVMLSMLVLSVLAATIVFTARSETLASYNWKLDTEADYLAKSGVQYATNWLRSTRYAAVSPTDAATYYKVTSVGGSYNLLTADTSPVQCLAASGCASAGSSVQLNRIPGSAASNYPLTTGTASYSTVVSNFNSDFPSTGVRVSGTSSNSGLVYINMLLLYYQTVNSGIPPNITQVPTETWLVTSRAVWTGTSSATSGVATAEELAIVQPIYQSTWGNALYGYCSVSMWGSSGTCTDAFNSAFGAYGGGNPSVASGACDSTTASNVIAAGAGVGANGYVSLASNVTVSGNVTIGPSSSVPSSCCTGSGCGYSGSTSSVKGQVVSGPNIAPPAVPTFRAGFPTSLSASYSYSLGSWATQVLPVGATWPTIPASPSTPPFPKSDSPVPTAPPLAQNTPCIDTTCNGTAANPYEIGSISMTGGGKGGGAPVLELIGGPDIFHPVYYDIDSLSQTSGSINVSGYIVLNIKSALSIGGNGISNGIDSSIPPECMQINYAGTSAVTINGNGAVSAVLTAPNATVTMGGGGSAGYFVGSVQAASVSVAGGYPVHYDLALDRAGGTKSQLVTTGYSRKKM